MPNDGSEQFRRIDFKRDWRFTLADPDGAERPEHQDDHWRPLALPHDWSVEHDFDQSLEGCTAYLPGGVGWYRKRFVSPEVNPDTAGPTFLVFDGIYNRSEVWLNGKRVAERPYGYSPILIDLADDLNPPGEVNVIAVRVDRRRFGDSRWYPGSGIYRDVWMVRKSASYIPVWGVRITTPEVSNQRAQVEVETSVVLAEPAGVGFELDIELFDADGVSVAKESSALGPGPDRERTLTQSLALKDPNLWSIDQPYLYRTVCTLRHGQRVVDVQETRFGIRSIRFDRDRGFLLNGEPTRVKGVCLHQDAGCVGVAVPDGVLRRRLQVLKDGGCNAIRTAHHPPSEAFLDLCDEMGMLVQHEFYDEWDNPKDKRNNANEKQRDFVVEGHDEFFGAWAERDLKDAARRDRNHPCVFMWSIGNEIEWTYPNYADATGFFDMDWTGNYFWETPPNSPEKIKAKIEATETGEGGSAVCAKTAAQLAKWTREMDDTRPITANCILPSASYASGYTDALDVVGYSYRRVMYDYGREISDLPIMANESLPQWHEWKALLEKTFVAGLFLWTGADYLGESNNQWPSKAKQSGLLDTASFPKPAYHLYKTLWSDEPHLAIFTTRIEDSPYTSGPTGQLVEKEPGSWQNRLWIWYQLNPHWEYESGQQIVVEAYTNLQEVRLTLNGKDHGIRRPDESEDRVCRWLVSFAPGELRVTGTGDAADEEILCETLVTPGEPAAVMLTADHHELQPGAGDVVHVVAQLVDAAGLPVRADPRRVCFEVGAGLTRLGVDNGWTEAMDSYAGPSLMTNNGRALLIARAEDNFIDAEVSVASDDLTSGRVTLRSSHRTDTAVLSPTTS